jgi:Spy/CpxP family protein refolding chaperone
MKTIVTTVVLLLLTVTVPAFSQMSDMPMKERGMGHGPMMQMGPMDKMGDMMGMCMEHAEMMGLSDDQLLKMKPIHSEMQKKQAKFMADVKIAEIELMGILEVKDFDLEKATAAVDKIEGIKTAHHQEMLKAMKEMRALLTDEQFKKMKKMMPMSTGDSSKG